ncbi:hypothetical protein ACHHYP_12831 [Achlya hypogyna]|uniref:Ubiquitin-like domain-containing protein n=1 Tax=Achlya hypogyna TaxID=1202772 RepID=A0A1V9YGB0_ACHHY|nr:hypothetical protein ACHHYP_12831 [Achlya hypogyna]
MADSDEELYVPTFEKRRVFVSLDSDSESDEDTREMTPVKRRRVVVTSQEAATAPLPVPATAAPVIVSLSSDSDDSADENDFEIQLKLANDPVLQQTQAILRKIQPVAAVVSTTDLSGDDTTITLGVSWTDATGAAQTEHIRMPGAATFETLMSKFCEQHALQPAGVRFVCDGVSVQLDDTPDRYDLEDADIVHAIVDFAKAAPPTATPTAATAKPPADAIRVRVRRTGGKTEIFRISKSMKVEKLLISFCNVHKLAQSAVTLKLFGEPLRLDETIEHYHLDSEDVVEAACDEGFEEESSSVPVTLRFLPGNESETYRIEPTALVETLVAKVCAKRRVDASSVKFKIDGDLMQPGQPFTTYDIEGDELIDVLIA